MGKAVTLGKRQYFRKRFDGSPYLYDQLKNPRLVAILGLGKIN